MDMKRSIYAFLAVGVLTFLGTGVASAETLQTEGTYPNREACQNAGPGVKASTPPFNWNNWWCAPDPHALGSWRLVLSSG
jgi:hypothetical protein